MGVQRGMYGRQVAGPTDENRLWDTVIEQIDPATGRVVGSVRLDAASLGWADAHHVYHYREDDYGRPFIDVWRVGWCGQARSVP